ncbi:MAG TPA: hypothetical protein VNZ44_13915 [Pyrinomonadaceae bacterium]|nr:hypothetical protein [Pyrinomonadaceae bacterium]
MTDSKLTACATRAREARSVSALIALFALLLLAAGAGFAQEGGKPAPSPVGAWQATLPNGVRAATLSFVPTAEGFAGAFVGYDYDRDPSKPSAEPPKVAMRSGAVLTDVKLDGDVLTFKMYLRHPSPPPGKPAGVDVSGEVRFTGGDAAELRISAPHKPEPLVLKLTRE